MLCLAFAAALALATSDAFLPAGKLAVQTRLRPLQAFATKAKESVAFDVRFLDQPVLDALADGHYLDTQRMHFSNASSPIGSFWQEVKFALKPRGKLPKYRWLNIKLGGSLPLATPPSLSSSGGPSLTALTTALATAAHDPRIDGVYLQVGGIAASAAHLQELRRYMRYFQQSGKSLFGFLPRTVTIDQLYVLGGCDIRATVPEAYLDVRGFSAPADFLRGVFDEVGIEPQVQRIGEYKSFGDRFSRRNMSDAQRETLESLLGSVSSHKLSQLARDSNRTVADLEALIDGGILDPAALVRFGLLDDLMYEDEAYALLRRLQRESRRASASPLSSLLSLVGGGSGNETQAEIRRTLQSAATPLDTVTVDMQKYLRATSRLRIDAAPGAKGGKTIAVIVAEGGIVDRSGDSAGSGDLVVDKFKECVQRALRDKSVVGVVIRVASPGGDALASDLMWRQVKLLRASGKPVVASIASVAASGGFYIAMAADRIVSEEQSITGSIGVVSAKFQLQKLFAKVGYSIERLSRGRFAEVMAFERPFTPDEERFFSENAMQSYENFVTKAAESRGLPLDVMQRRAQGRVWSGWQGRGLGLVDELGGIQSAIDLCRSMADYRDEYVKIYRSTLKLLRGTGPLPSPSDAPPGGARSPEGAAAAAAAAAGKLAATGDPADEEIAVAAARAAGLFEEYRAQIQRWGLGAWRVDSYADVLAHREAAAVAAAAEGVEGGLAASWPLLPGGQVLADAAELKLIERRAREPPATRVKYIAPAVNPLAALLRAFGLAGLSSMLGMEGGGGGMATAMAELSALNGRPLAIMDDAIGRAFPGIACVPEEYRSLGVGPLGWQLLSRSPEVVRLLGEMLRNVASSALLKQF